jgi:hypothetical protein
MIASVVARVADYYLTSGDSNGYPVRNLSADFAIASDTVPQVVAGLVKAGRVTTVTSHEENPYIKRFPDLSKCKQLELLATADTARKNLDSLITLKCGLAGGPSLTLLDITPAL